MTGCGQGDDAAGGGVPRQGESVGATAGTARVGRSAGPGDGDAGRQLAEARAEARTLFDTALSGLLLERDGRIEKVNARWAEQFGYPPAAVVGRDGAFLFPSAREHQAFRQAADRDLAAGGEHVGEYRLRRADGGPIDMRCRGRRIGGEEAAGRVVWAFADITETKRLEAELRATKAAAEEASLAKARFVANLSHELRTPLNGIIGLSQLLLDSDAAGETREHLAVIRQSAGILRDIVDELLDLSTVEAGRIVLHPVAFRLQDELLPLLRNFASQSRTRAFDFAYQFDARLPVGVIADPNRLRQICITLIGNAFKHTRKGSVTVRFALAEAGQALVGAGKVRLAVTVTDTGVGIEPGRQASLFEPFGIGDDPRTKQYAGAGVDLAVARRLARIMDGDIVVDSAPGRGSAFVLTFACALPAASRPAATAEPAAPRATGKPGLRILLAEDEPVNRIYTVRALQKLGHQVKTAADGREALVMLAREPFDLVLMDIQMPRLNGLEATRLIRSGQVAGNVTAIPVVALTAYAMEADRERGLEAGMDEYVAKPFEPRELAEAMERALAK
ncbi:MAG: response regulator [Solidesulfovibrio sp.]|uniref:PAS domain-containing hybrid sensor histidine kinase/response regulator n=1 Tax=Solidesulfovibrio sp. TaxID=2910990 RepID=UPI00315805C3